METPSIRYAFYVLAETPTVFLGVTDCESQKCSMLANPHIDSRNSGTKNILI